MKVLFVRSGNNGIDPISTNQGESLKQAGVEVEYFDLIGQGLIGYLNNITVLRSQILEINPDIIHAHYSLCGYISVLTFVKKPIICSLMGSDVVYGGRFANFILNLFISRFWSETIVKSNNLLNRFSQKRIHVIPNGVNLFRFKQEDQIESKKLLGWNLEKKYILFASNPSRPEKNYCLALDILARIKENKVDTIMIPLMNIESSIIQTYYNAADFLLLTSLSEGSPNVIKEAMACNCPIVATDVGDVKDIVKDTRDCLVSNFDLNEMVDASIKILSKSTRSNGRTKIEQLDDKIIANKLITIYTEAVRKV